jgi:glycosyltransferase involved in cell wall biosynthesis
MNILVANWTWFPSGGDWTYVEQLNRLYERKGHTVIPFSMIDSRNMETAYSKYFVSHMDYKDMIKEKSLKNATRVLRRSIYSMEAARNLQRLLEAVKIDYAHLNNIHHFLTSSIVKVLNDYNIPIIWTIHDYSLICPENSLICNGSICERCRGGKFYMCTVCRCKKKSYSASAVASLENYLYRMPKITKAISAYICPSKFVYNKFIENGYEPDKLFQLYHCYDEHILEVSKQKPDMLPERYVVFIGRMESIKGVLTLLDAFMMMRNIPLVMVGYGSLEERIKNILIQKKITNVYLTGKKIQKEVLNILTHAQFSICPSEWYEVLGFSIVESMLMSKPVIGSNLGGIPELVIDGKTGLTFRPGNAEQLKEKVQFLWNNTKVKDDMSRKALEHVRILTNPEEHYQGLMQIIKSNGKIGI